MTDKRVYHLLHCRSRARQRYGIELTEQDYDAMCDAFRNKKVPDTRVDNLGNVEGWVQVQGVWVCASYQPGPRLVGTIMPAPPPRMMAQVATQQAGRGAPTMTPLLHEQIQAEISKRSKAEATGLVRQALQSGHRPKWLSKDVDKSLPEENLEVARQNAGPTETRQAILLGQRRDDLAWVKRQIDEATHQIKDGKIFSALVTLNIAKGLPHNLHTTSPEFPAWLEKETQSCQSYWEDYWRSLENTCASTNKESNAQQPSVNTVTSAPPSAGTRALP